MKVQSTDRMMNNMEIPVNIIDTSMKMLKKYPLCSRCLGRQYALLGKQLSNLERGEAIKTVLLMEIHNKLMRNSDAYREELKALARSQFKKAQVLYEDLYGEEIPEEKCYICGNLWRKLNTIAEKVIDLIKNIEFSTFLVGCRIPAEIIEKEDNLRAEFKLEYGESFKNHFNRELGRLIRDRLNKEVDFQKPEITIIVEPFAEKVEVVISPLFIYGRYRKLVRGLPQTRYRKNDKLGRVVYNTSIEEIIGEPLLEAAQGEEFKFHGAGREDIDVRMLGNGRPFIVEIRRPKKRNLDLKKLEEIINNKANGLVEVMDLRYSNRHEVREIKKMAEISKKIYRAIVEFKKAVSDEDIEKILQELNDITVLQRTPLRVLHRRKDKVRRKRVYDIKVRRLGDNVLEIILTCQGGLYIKELIHGDEGRTNPNIADIINNTVIKIELDVLDIIY